MRRLSKYAIAALALSFFALPAVSLASTLTSQQASAIIGLLQAFGVDQSILVQVEQTLGVIPATPPAPTPTTIPYTRPIGSPYTSSGLGYDLSFATASYPGGGDFFNFGVIGVTGGKAFVDNKRFPSELAWARTGSINLPTLYMNLNAPYGSFVAANISGPNSCPPNVSTSTEPTSCQGYNFGYNAAMHAFAYAKGYGMTSSLWWLDIEEANSWSADTTVNDATIQGAIDYLNMQGARVGIYSVRYMWNNIAGTTFVPSQIVNGAAVYVPSWIAIGTDTQLGALNTCITSGGFIAGSPIWVVQYEADSTAVDQNIAC